MQQDEWQQFYGAGRGPRWPNETMVKLIYGSYLRRRVQLPDRAVVLDIGCGSGNNLVPFAADGHECHGVEITPDLARQTQHVLASRDYEAIVVHGSNRSLPYDDHRFDLVLSINVIHYEGDEQGVRAALAEARRVLRPGGALVLSTVGPEHEIARRSEPLGDGRHRVADYDFRDGQTMWFAGGAERLADVVGSCFADVETGEVRERLADFTGNWLFAVGWAD